MKLSKSRSRAIALETRREDRVMTPLKDTEILPLGEHMKLIRLDIPVTNQFLEVLQQLCKIREKSITLYIDKALHDQVDLDLENPQDIGMDVCKNLKYIIHPSQ